MTESRTSSWKCTSATFTSASLARVSVLARRVGHRTFLRGGVHLSAKRVAFPLVDVHLRSVPKTRRLVFGDGAHQRDATVAKRVRSSTPDAPRVRVHTQLRHAIVQRAHLALILDVIVLVLVQRALHVHAFLDVFSQLFAKTIEPPVIVVLLRVGGGARGGAGHLLLALALLLSGGELLLRGGALGRRRLRRRGSLDLSCATSPCRLSIRRWYSLMCDSTVCRFCTTCVLISLARSAYLSVLMVCAYWSPPQLTLATIAVREFPESPSFSRRGQLRVSKRHVHTLTAVFLTKRVDAIGERQQRSVYVPTVSQFLTHVERL